MWRENGFTLLELVVIIVLIGVLAAVAIPRISDNSIRNASASEQVKAALRYAQRVAVSSGCPIQVQLSSAQWRVVRQDGGTEQGCGNGTFGTLIPNPSGGMYQIPVPPSTGTVTGGSVTFDAQGLPNPANVQWSVGNQTLRILESGHVE